MPKFSRSFLFEKIVREGIGQNKTFEQKEEPPFLLRLRLSRRYPGLFWDQIRPLKVVPTPLICCSYCYISTTFEILLLQFCVLCLRALGYISNTRNGTSLRVKFDRIEFLACFFRPSTEKRAKKGNFQRLALPWELMIRHKTKFYSVGYALEPVTKVALPSLFCPMPLG